MQGEHVLGQTDFQTHNGVKCKGSEHGLADVLLEVAEPVFRAAEWFKQAEMTRRYGPAEEETRRTVTQFGL